MSTSSIGRISATVALLFGLGGCAYFPGFDTEYAAQIQKAGGLPNGNLVPALIKVGDKAAESGDREAAVRLYGRAAMINPEHPDAARAIARASELVDQIPPPAPPASNGATSTTVKTSALATGVPTPVPTPVWAQPNASSPASSTDPRHQPGAEAAKAPPVQINVIDLTDKETSITTLKNKNNDTAITSSDPSPGPATSQAVTAAASTAPAEASTGEHDILIANAGAEPVKTPRPTTKARQSKPVVTPPPLPDTRRAADETVKVAESRDVEPQDVSEEKYEDISVSGLKNGINGDSDEAAPKPEPTDAITAAHPKDADAAAMVAAPIEASRTSDAKPDPKPKSDSKPEGGLRSTGDRSASAAPEQTLTIDSRTGLQDTKPSGFFSVDASGMKASALAAAEAAEASAVPDTSTAPSETPAAAAPVQPHKDSAPEPETVAGETPATHAVAESATYQVQLAAYRSEALATRGWNRIKIASQGALDIVKPMLIRVETQDQGTVYRLRVGGFDERSAALAFCTDLKSKSIDCFVAATDQALPALQVAGAPSPAAGKSGT